MKRLLGRLSRLGLLALMFLILPIPCVAQVSPSMQFARIPVADSPGNIGPRMNMSDRAVDLYLQTPWRTDVPTSEEVAKQNASVELDVLSGATMDVAPCIPAKSIENGSASNEAPYVPAVSSSAEMSSATMNWFPGHTWSWQYGTTDRHVRAPEVTRPMEGNWFPKTDYSRIIYQVNITQGMKVYFRIDRGADTISRVVRLYVGGVRLLEDTIWYYQTYYSSYVTLSVTPGWYYVALEINLGGYVDKGWCLRYWDVIKPDSEGYYQAVRTDYQQFRKVLSSELVFRVPMGPKTILKIETLNCGDISLRYLYVYVDGAGPVQTLYSPGAYSVQIYDYFTPGMHELKLVLYYGNGGWGEYPKSIRQLYVTYGFKYVEVDSMTGHAQPQSVLDYVQAYYNTHDYRRVEFQPNDNNLPHEVLSNETRWDALYNQYCDPSHKSDSKWTWGLFCHRFYSLIYGVEVWGMGEVAGKRFVIADYPSGDNGKKWILMHEFGHTQNMLHDSGYKYDVYPMEQYNFTYVDWTNPHYVCSSWTYHLSWIVGWW